jgi:[acyl-carrier-protein] S-malonyltransferase
MSFEQALCVVQVRGTAMEKAASAVTGGMVAVLDLTFDQVESIAEATGVVIANDNSPRQVVLAGDDESLVEAASRTRAEGGRAVRLDVSGPFHTPQVVAAAPLLRDALEHISIRSPRVPVISNVSAAAYRAPGEIRQLLVQQLTSRVRFREALEGLWLNGINDFHDFGPGKIVAGLASRTFDSLQLTDTANVG